MNAQRTDIELLRDFVRRGDQRAFASIVQRHVDLVYGTAMRKIENSGGAEEVTQNVFAALARKAWQFAPDDSLPAWLHRTALLEAKQWLRGELRRQQREKTAVELETIMKTSHEEPALRAFVPMLDEALLSLREKDRTALLLRFYQGQSMRELATSLGIGEDAAQKRVTKALEKLAGFFQRRGFRTATGALAAAALQQTSTSAPAAIATSAAQAAAQFPALGLPSLLSHVAGLTKSQTATLCLVLAAAPIGWQWNQMGAAQKQQTLVQSALGSARVQEAALSAELDRERATLAGIMDNVTVAAEDPTLLQQSETMRSRIRSLLTEPNYRWPANLHYVRIPKSAVSQIDLQGAFSSSGKLSDAALELYGITPAEQAVAEEALGNYWRGIESMMSIQAYETNALSPVPGRITRTVVIPPLGQELKDLADQTRQRLSDRLGPEREKLIFGGWGEGAIQIFWPGNLWKISEEPQQFTVWIDPAADPATPGAYGASWKSTKGGTSSEGPGSLSVFPASIVAKFFSPWLQQFGVPTTSP